MTLQRWLVKTYNDNKQNTDVDADISKLIAAVFRVCLYNYVFLRIADYPFYRSYSEWILKARI